MFLGYMYVICFNLHYFPTCVDTPGSFLFVNLYFCIFSPKTLYVGVYILGAMWGPHVLYYFSYGCTLP